MPNTIATVMLLALTTTNAIGDTLLVQTQGGKVSIIHDLSARECKIAACRLKQEMTCFPQTCDDDGNLHDLRTNPGSSTCMMNGSESRPTLVECLK